MNGIGKRPIRAAPGARPGALHHGRLVASHIDEESRTRQELPLKLPLAFALLFASASTHAAAPIHFYYTNDQVLAAKDADAAGKEWFAACVEGGEFAQLATRYAPDPQITREQREADARKFDRAAFERIAQASYDRVVEELPQKPLTLCVDFTRADDAFARDRMGGVMALTAGSGKLIVKIHPDADWQVLLPYVLGHELQHSYWAQYHFDASKPFTLGDYLVFEGRADNFAMHAFGKHPAPWTDALDPGQYEKILQQFDPLFGESSPQVLAASMFGNPQAGIPLWAGYTVGYRLVAKKIADEHPGDWRQISALPAAQFLPDGARPAKQDRKASP